MNSREKQIISKIDNKILSNKKLIEKLKKYPNQKCKISIMNLINLEISNKNLVDYFEKYSQISNLVKIKSFL